MVRRVPAGTSAVMEATEDAADDRVDRILRSAERVLMESGEIRMQNVAAQAGVSLSTLYACFPSKDLLVLRVGVVRMRRGLDGLRANAPLPGETPGERLATFLLRYFRAAQREPAVARALMLLDPAGEVDGDLEALSRARTALVDVIQEMAITAAVGGGPPLAAEAASMILHALSMLHLGCMAWLFGARSAADVRRSVAFGALLLDLPDSYARGLLGDAERLASRVR